MGNNTVIDLDYLNDLSMGDDTLVIEMIELFLDSSPEVIHNLRRHHKEENWKSLSGEAHKFKTTLSYMGMNQVKMIVEEIEEKAKQQEKDEETEEKIDRIEEMCKQAYGELNQKLNDLKN